MRNTESQPPNRLLPVCSYPNPIVQGWWQAAQTTPRSQGFAAWGMSKKPDDCPYPLGRDHDEWIAGWRQRAIMEVTQEAYRLFNVKRT